jgi:hypothetical protein
MEQPYLIEVEGNIFGVIPMSEKRNGVTFLQQAAVPW